MNWTEIIALVTAVLLTAGSIVTAVLASGSKIRDKLDLLRADLTTELAALRTELAALRTEMAALNKGKVEESFCRPTHDAINETLGDLRHRVGEIERKLMRTPEPRSRREV